MRWPNLCLQSLNSSGQKTWAPYDADSSLTFMTFREWAPGPLGRRWRKEVVACPRLFAEISPSPVYYSGQRIYCAVFHPNQLRVHVFLKDNNSRLSRAAVSPSPHGDADPSSKLAMQRGTRCTRITNSLKKPSRHCFFFTRW